MPSLGNLLAYGAIGLGLALAVLAYLLLRKEQTFARPRAQILRAIYVFMGFSLILSAAGFLGEYNKLQMNLNSSRSLIRTLMDLKGGKVERLKQLDPNAVEYRALVREIQVDLVEIDRSLSDALGE